MFKLLKKKRNRLMDVDEHFVFDKAKYHFESVDYADLEEKQAYIHTGLFFAWIIKNNLYSEEFLDEFEEQIEETRSERVSPAELYMNLDGEFIGELLNLAGYNFAMHYYHLHTGEYIHDYESIFGSKKPDIYRVEDNWENYNIIAKVIDEKYEKWNEINIVANLSLLNMLN